MKDRWIWKVRQPDDDRVIPDGMTSKYHESILNLLNIRGLNDIQSMEAFLSPQYGALGSPYALKDMDKAVDVLQKGIAGNRRIVVYGDYDVDGITSISILLRSFAAMGIPLDFYIPDRMDEGYGLNMEAIRKLADDHDIMITVDCGITAIPEIDEARRLGMEVIVTDHHECPEVLPVAEAVINPKRNDNSGACELLAGAGVAFQLAKAFYEIHEGKALADQLLADLLELAAVGTIADVAPLQEDNRIIAKLGLEALNDTRNKGLAALIRKSGLEEKKLNAGHVGFMIGPKINASGRIGNPSDSVTLLTSEQDDEVERIASELVLLNTERQMIEREILEACIRQVEEKRLQHDKVIVVSGEGYHSGVIGIVASRLVERYHRPTLVFSIDGETARASARSIETVNLYQLLSGCRKYYLKFGGHEMAAGLTIHSETLEAFHMDVLAEAERVMVEEDLIPVLKVDGILKMTDVQLKLLEQLDLLEPYGMGNPKPVFAIKEVPLQMVKRMGKNEEHLKWLVQDDVRMIDCVMFNARDTLMAIPQKSLVRMAFTMERNHFRGVESLQLSLKDARRVDILDEGLCRWSDVQKGINHVNAIGSCLRGTDEPSYGGSWQGRLLPGTIEDCGNILAEDSYVTYFLTDSERIFNQFINTHYDQSYRSLAVSVGETLRPSSMHIVLRPDIDRLKTQMDRCLEECRVFYLDESVEARTNGATTLSGKLKSSDFPSRDQLVKLYKFVRDNEDKSYEFHLEKLQKETMMGGMQLGIALELLRGMGMVEHVRTENGFRLELLPFQGKVNLEEHPLFLAVRNSIE